VRVALDTNRLTDFFRGDRGLEELLSNADEVWVPLVVLGEIKGGYRLGPRQALNEAALQRFLAKENVDVLLPDRDTAEYYAGLFAQLRRAGTPVPANDLWIASSVLQHNLTLITRDRHFDRIPQLLLA